MTDICPGSVMGTHGDPDRHGKCPWCTQKIRPALPKPPLGRGYMTELDEAYGYIYDPDYGSARSIHNPLRE